MYKYFLFFSLFILNLSYSQVRKEIDQKYFDQKFNEIYSAKTVSQQEAIDFCQKNSFFLSNANYLTKNKNFQLKINSLLKTKDLGKEIIAFYIIGEIKDRSREKILISYLNQNYRFSLRYAYISLIKINPTDLDFVFKLAIQRNYQFEFFHFLDYIDKNRILNYLPTQLSIQNLENKFLLLEILKYFGDKENYIIPIILKDFDLLYANNTDRILLLLGDLRVDNVLPYLKKNINKQDLKELEIYVLSSSTTTDDNDLVKEFITQQQSLKNLSIIPILRSRNKIMLHFLLQQIKVKSCEDSFETTRELLDDEFLNEIHSILKSTTNKKIIISLVGLLADRNDNTSINIMLNFLDSEDESIRNSVINSYSKTNNNSIFKNRAITDKLKKLGIKI